MKRTWIRPLVVSFAAVAMALAVGRDVRAAWFDWAYPPRTVQGVYYAAAPALGGCTSCAASPAAVLPVTSQYRAATAYAAYYPGAPVVAYRPAAVVAYSPVACGSCAPAPVVTYRPVFGWARPLGYAAYASYAVAYVPSYGGCATCAAIPACDPCASCAPCTSCAPSLGGSVGCESCVSAPAATTTYYAPSSDYDTPSIGSATTSEGTPSTRIESSSGSGDSRGNGAASSSGSSLYGAEPTPKTFVQPPSPSNGAAGGSVGGGAKENGGASDSGEAGEHSTLRPIPESGSFLNSTPAAPKLIDPKDRTTSRDFGRAVAEQPRYQPVARTAAVVALPTTASSGGVKPPLDNSGWRASRD